MNTHNFLYKIAVVLLLSTVLIGLESCKKDDIAPAKEDTVFVKYYGHVGSQEAGDVSQTADGGYIMIGSTNSYSQYVYSDILVVKTDTAGNEAWSMVYGNDFKAANNNDIKYDTYIDEVGERIIELPNEEGYILMANRTYFWDEEDDGTLTPFKTKILLYQIDIAGGVVAEVELKTLDGFSYWGYDIKQNSDGGFVIVGETSNVNKNKPQYNLYKDVDKRDIFIVRLNSDFTETWASGADGSQGKGFVGLDRGVSVEVSTDDHYIVVGRVAELDNTNTLENNIIVVKYNAANGGIVNQKTYGQNVNANAVSSCYDSINNTLVVLGDYKENSTTKQQLVVFKVEVAGLNIDLSGSLQFYPGTSNDISGEFGGTISSANNIGSDIIANDIALLKDEGYLVLATNGEANNGLESQILMFKLDQSLGVVPSSERYFGYNSFDNIFSSSDVGSQIITVSETIAGTTQSKVSSYMFTGTFDTGTNDMIGLVKVTTDGVFDPDGE